MNQFNFYMPDAISGLILAYFVGWTIGILVWILRFIMIDLPHIKGGDNII